MFGSRIAPASLVLSLSAVLLAPGVPAAATDLGCGDVNESNDVNTSDALLILRKSVDQPVDFACGPAAPVLSTAQNTCHDTEGEAVTCAGTGQDADVAAGVTHAFAVIEAGTITDLRTSLQWEVLTDDGGIHDRDAALNWGGAAVKLAVLNGQNFAGHNDWRLPNEFELQTLINYDRSFPATFVESFDQNCTPGCTAATCSCVPSGNGDLWSNTSSVDEPDRAWAMRTTNGVLWPSLKISELRARVVRGGVTTAPAADYCADSNGNGSITSSDAQLVLRAGVGQEVALSCAAPAAVRKTGQTQCFNGNGDAISCAGTSHDGELQRGIAPSFTDNEDGTITDNNTKLMWEKLGRDGGIHEYGSQYQWPGAFSNKIGTLNSTSFAGYNDWRVPNVAELLSLADLGRSDPAVHPIFNSDCDPGCSSILECSCPSLSGLTWSSTSFANGPSEAWYVDLNTGYADTHDKNTIHNVRAVRGGIR